MEVVEVVSSVNNLRVGDRVAAPFPISCGNCYSFQKQLCSLCENSNPVVGVYDQVKQIAKIETDRPPALREAIMACRNGGTVSVPGVYGGFVDKFPMGSAMNRSLTIRTGQTHVQRYIRPLLEKIQSGQIDPTFIITQTMLLDDAPRGYDIFKNKKEDWVKVVLKPGTGAASAS